MSNTNNPFNITFGKEPLLAISRDYDLDIIYNSFQSENPDNNLYIITGARGVGKTVAMTMISNYFSRLQNWLIIELNPEIDLLEQLASKIYEKGKIKHLFLNVEFNFGFKGANLTITGKNNILNVATFLEKELEYLKKKGIKTLITIDEASSNANMKIFAHEFQSLLRKDFSIFLLMTGLYQNISLLQNQKNLTFLNRAPKVYLTELNVRAVVNSYQKIFKINEKEGIQLAKLTNGYAYAYQLLGNILYNENKIKIDREIITKYDEILYERVYELIYQELSETEKAIVKAASVNSNNAYILEKTKMKKNQLSNNKKTLSRKGIICDNYRNNIVFRLPRFKEFIQFTNSYEE
ncbi:MAG: ATP-binding protein [Bacilli bacterium]|nr:ATP-binding protein [Bacilli bacterium]